MILKRSLCLVALTDSFPSSTRPSTLPRSHRWTAVTAGVDEGIHRGTFLKARVLLFHVVKKGCAPSGTSQGNVFMVRYV